MLFLWFLLAHYATSIPLYATSGECLEVLNANRISTTPDTSRCTSFTISSGKISIDATPYLCLANDNNAVFLRNCDDEIMATLCLDVSNRQVVYNGKCTVRTDTPVTIEFQNIYDINLGTCLQTWPNPPNTITSTDCSANTNQFAVIDNKILINDGKPYFNHNIDNRQCLGYNITDSYKKMIQVSCNSAPIIGFTPSNQITLGAPLTNLCVDNGGGKFTLGHAYQCADNNTSQKWTLDINKVRGGKLHHNGKCLGLTLVDQDCNGAPTWNWQSDNKLKASNGQCLAVINKSLTLDNCDKVGYWPGLCLGNGITSCITYSFFPLF